MTADIDDFDLPTPRARRPRPKAGAAGRTAAADWRGRTLALVRRYPLELLITFALCGAVGAVAYNALALQTSRHPAPLFGQGGRLDGPAPLPPARPAFALPAAPAPSPGPAAAAGPVRAPAPAR